MNFNVIIFMVIPTSCVSTFPYCCKNVGIPQMCTFTWCTFNMIKELARWWSYESKHVAIFIIDNKLVVFWLNQLLEYLSGNTSGCIQLKYWPQKLFIGPRTNGSAKCAPYNKRNVHHNCPAEIQWTTPNYNHIHISLHYVPVILSNILLPLFYSVHCFGLVLMK